MLVNITCDVDPSSSAELLNFSVCINNVLLSSETLPYFSV